MPRARNKKNTPKVISPLINTDVKQIETYANRLEQFLRADLEHLKNRNQILGSYDRVKKELADAEEELGRIKNKKGNAKNKVTLNAKVNEKNEWLNDVNEATKKNFLSLLDSLLHGYPIDLVVNQKEHIRKEGMNVQNGCVEYEKLLATVIQKEIKIEGKLYTKEELDRYTKTFRRFSESIRSLVLSNKAEITPDRIKRVLSGNDLTIEHACDNHAIYTQVYKEGNQLVIIHCNRGLGFRSSYNLVYRINSSGLNNEQLRTALEKITGLEVKNDDEAEYQKFYEEYDKTLKNIGFNFSWGKHLKIQKIGNCVLANLQGLLKERFPDEVYKWCTSEIRDLSSIQHLITPMLQMGKNLQNRYLKLDTDDDFFHLRQLINYILDKSVEGIINSYFGNNRKLEAVKNTLNALNIYENIINNNKVLSEGRKEIIKNYINSKIGSYKEILNNPGIHNGQIFYRVLLNEAEKINADSSGDPSKEFFKYLITKAASNPNCLSDFYYYFSHEKREERSELLKTVLTQTIETINDVSVLNDPENIGVYQNSLRKILLDEYKKIPCDQELINYIAKLPMININTTVFSTVFSALKAQKNNDANLKFLLASTLGEDKFLDKFTRDKNKQSQSSIFFKPMKSQEFLNFFDFFKNAAEFIIKSTKPLKRTNLQLNIDRMFDSTMYRISDKNKVKRFLELFCYKQLIDSNKINSQNINVWNNLSELANQCKQLGYYFPEAIKIADEIIDNSRKLKVLSASKTNT